METGDSTAKLCGLTILNQWIKSTLASLATVRREQAEQAVQHVLDTCPLRSYPINHHQIWGDVPYALLHCCMKHQIQNSDLISQVLRFSWMVLRDFSVLFLRSKRRLRTFEVLPPFVLEHDDDQTQSYFMNHSRACHQFIEGYRLVDTLSGIHGTSPIFEAIYDCNVQNVKILLQYGCDLQLTGLLDPKSVFVQEFSSLMERNKLYRQWFQERSVAKLFNLLRVEFVKSRPRKRKQCDSDLSDDFSTSSLQSNPKVKDIFKVLNLIFRCIPNLGPEILSFPICAHSALILTPNLLSLSRNKPNMIWDLDQEYWKFLTMLCSNGFIPSLLERTSHPAKLKHLCRCAIRQHLNANWQLPFGVHQLHLPQSLKNYLSIEED